MDSQPLVLTAADPEPDLNPGTIVVVHYGDYRRQQAFVVSGANIGNLYPLGGEFDKIKQVDDPRDYMTKTFGHERWQQPAGTVPLHPTWRDVVALGPVTILFAAPQDIYRQGWDDGRKDLVGQIEALAEEGPDDVQFSGLGGPIIDGDTVPAHRPGKTNLMPAILAAVESGQPMQEGDLIDGQARTIPSNVLEVECAGFVWRRATPDDPAEFSRAGWVSVDGQGCTSTNVLIAFAPLQVTRVKTPAPARAHVEDLIGPHAAGISANVHKVVDSEGDVYRRAVGDERYATEDLTDGELDLRQEYEWVRIGYQVGNTFREGEPTGHSTTEGLLDYTPLRVLEVSDTPTTTTQEGPTP